MQIETKIKDLINKSGPISLSRYMEICLWDEENGYYNSNEVLGEKGDFITSPEISQTFGVVVPVRVGLERVWLSVLVLHKWIGKWKFSHLEVV